MAVWITGWILVFVATVIAVIATIQNLQRARGSMERRFVFWSCMALWGLTLVALALAVHWPSPWRYIAMAVYMALVLPGIYWAAMRRQLIRKAEQVKKSGHSKQG